MLHDLLMDIKLDKFGYYRHLETTAIESACSEMSVGQLEDILRKYTTFYYGRSSTKFSQVFF